MNRIEEIKVDTDKFCDQNYSDAPEVYYNLMWEDKFAELIVKETIGEMLQQMWNYGIDESNNPSMYKAVDRTKEHFGVE